MELCDLNLLCYRRYQITLPPRPYVPYSGGRHDEKRISNLLYEPVSLRPRYKK